jgi:hypothetical protein
MKTRWRAVSSFLVLGCALCFGSCLNAPSKQDRRDLNTHSSIELLDAISANDTSAVRRLLNSGWAPNRGRNGVPSSHPMCVAACIGRPEMVTLLAEAGGDVDGKWDGAKYPPAMTPLAAACWLTNHNVAIQLLDLGADVNAGSMTWRPIIYCSLFNQSELLQSVLRRRPTRASMIVGARIAQRLEHDRCFALIVASLNGGRVPRSVDPENWLEHVLDGLNWPIEAWETEAIESRRRSLREKAGLLDAEVAPRPALDIQ